MGTSGMVTSGAFATTATDSIILAADPDREKVTLQHISGHECFLGFGVAAVKKEGIKLLVDTADSRFVVHGALAKKAIHGVNNTAEATVGGYLAE